MVLCAGSTAGVGGVLFASSLQVFHRCGRWCRMSCNCCLAWVCYSSGLHCWPGWFSFMTAPPLGAWAMSWLSGVGGSGLFPMCHVILSHGVIRVLPRPCRGHYFSSGCLCLSFRPMCSGRGCCFHLCSFACRVCLSFLYLSFSAASQLVLCLCCRVVSWSLVVAGRPSCGMAFAPLRCSLAE